MDNVMRIKLFYSPQEITNNLYTFGKEWMTTDSAEYIGLYHKYTTGEVYTEGVWDSAKSKKLIVYEAVNTTKLQYKQLKNLNVVSITPTPYQPENEINATGQQQIQRYFLQKKNDNVTIIEIDSTQYELLLTNKIDQNLYSGVQLTWYISGAINDTYINNTKQFGVISKNTNSLKTAEKNMPGISKKLNNLTELYTDTDFVVPRDINLG
jgi:hypothetical protein